MVLLVFLTWKVGGGGDTQVAGIPVWGGNAGMQWESAVSRKGMRRGRRDGRPDLGQQESE